MGTSTLISPTSGKLLAAWEAALHLGITPELLFYYTSHSFQKRPGEKRRLVTHDVDGSTRFSTLELDAFDNYLREPWAEVGEARRDPPQKILAYLHAESGGSCVRCGSGIAVETAHIESWATSRCNHHHNLLRICSSCHSEHDSHHSLLTSELRRLKSVGIERLKTNIRSRLSLGPNLPAPAPESMFAGRTKELAALRDMLRTDRYVLLHGPGGIGKTQLLLQALRVANTGRPVFWVEAERYENLEALRTALEVSIRSVHHDESQPFAFLLDKTQACLVIDGLEQLEAWGIDATDDWIANLQGNLAAAQIVVTSQADLALTRFDSYLRLTGIESSASKNVLDYFLKRDTPTDASSMAELVSFADGHPLTLRILAMLINHFGSSTTALTQVQLRGAKLLEVQKRFSQNRHTSLKTCLSLAYEALIDDERKLLYVVANAPGGLFSLVFDHETSPIADGRAAIAGVRRWGLIETEDQGGTRERIDLLSPIASYVITRWHDEQPKEAQQLTKDLARDFSVMAAVIDMHSEKDEMGGIPRMLSRIEEELPNFLWVLDLADKSDDADLGKMARSICFSLMQYFFVLRLGDLGSRVMLRGARIALREGDARGASGLLTQMIGLSDRSDGRVDVKPALELIDDIERDANDPETLGNTALCRSMAVSLKHDHAAMAAHARVAISYFEKALGSFNEDAADPQIDEISTARIENDLSSSYSLLGNALLADVDYAAAGDAYRRALALMRGASIAVNEGQLHHQIGNCEANLGHLLEAASRYTAAARQFHAINMLGYLGNALGEFGNLLLEFPVNGSWPDLPNIEIIASGVTDVAETLEGCFGQYPFDLAACARAHRNLLGLTVLLSFSNAVAPLSFPSSLRSSLLPWAQSAVEAMDDIWWDEMGGEAVSELRGLLQLGDSIVEFERQSRGTASEEFDVTNLAAACARLGYWGGHRQKGFTWLVLYLNRRWALLAGSSDELEERAKRLAPDEKILLLRAVAR